MFPQEESAKQLICLALRRIMEKWKLPDRAWSEAMTVFLPYTVSDLPQDRFNCRGVLKQCFSTAVAVLQLNEMKLQFF